MTTSIYNLILGKLYCDHYGTMRIDGNREYSCKLKFKEQSIIDRNPHQVISSSLWSFAWNVQDCCYWKRITNIFCLCCQCCKIIFIGPPFTIFFLYHGIHHRILCLPTRGWKKKMKLVSSYINVSKSSWIVDYEDCANSFIDDVEDTITKFNNTLTKLIKGVYLINHVPSANLFYAFRLG